MGSSGWSSSWAGSTSVSSDSMAWPASTSVRLRSKQNTARLCRHSQHAVSSDATTDASFQSIPVFCR